MNSLSVVVRSIWPPCPTESLEETFLTRGTGLIYCSTPVAGFASGLIAYGVQKHLQHTGGYMAWQWLFIIEGIPTIALGLVVLVLLPSLPDRIAKTGHFLFKDPKEREIMLQRQLSGSFAPLPLSNLPWGFESESEADPSQHSRPELGFCPDQIQADPCWIEGSEILPRRPHGGRSSTGHYRLHDIPTYLYQGIRILCL